MCYFHNSIYIDYIVIYLFILFIIANDDVDYLVKHNIIQNNVLFNLLLK